MRRRDLQGKGWREEMEVWKWCNYIKISNITLKIHLYIIFMKQLRWAFFRDVC